MFYWVFAFAVVILLATIQKFRRLKTFQLEWGLIRLEFEPESNEPRIPLEPRQPRQIEAKNKGGEN